ncbi:MAG: MMPL family transporter [Planctomycetes bacterium]|nr:MMPL family transporter [Planctomycetota bacterium]
MNANRTIFLVRIFGAISSRPRLVLCAAVMVAGLAVWSTTRIHPATSIASMLATDDPASKALALLADRFATGDELIVLATLPSSVNRSEGRRQLVQFAQKLESEIAGDAESARLCRRTTYKPDAGFRRFFESEILPAALYYLDDESFARFKSRLTADAIRERLRRNEELLSTPGIAGQILAKQILRDPLGLHELLIESVRAPRRGIESMVEEDIVVSKDGRTAMIRVAGIEPAGHTEFSKRITRAVFGAVDRANVDGLQIEYTGGYAIAATAERSIRSDMIRSIFMSTVFLLLLFFFVYRHWVASIVALAPVALGILTAFGISSFLSTELTPVVAVIGAVLAGLGIDYGIHFLSHYAGDGTAGLTHDQKTRRTIETVGPAMSAACVTSIIGFVAISRSGVAALRQFSIIGALGLACILIASLTLLPALLWAVGRDNRRSATPRLLHGGVEPLLSSLNANRKRWITMSVVVMSSAVAICGLSPHGWFQFETDLTVMHPRPNPPLDAQRKLKEAFEHRSDGLFLYMKATSETEMAALAHEAARRLNSEVLRGAGVVGTFGAANLLPDPEGADARSAAIRDIDADAVLEDFRTALADSPFNPAAFDDYIEFLSALFDCDPPPSQALRRHPSVAELFFPIKAVANGGPFQEAITVVRLQAPLSDRFHRDRVIKEVRDALEGLSGVTLTGMSVVGHDTERLIRRDLSRLLGVAAILVAGWLLLYFRSFVHAMLAFLPAAFGLASLLAIMTLFDMRLNMVNLIGLPLLVGIGVDDGIFLVSLTKRRNGSDTAGSTAASGPLAPACHAVLMTTLTTVLTFGTLAFTSTPAIRSLGIMLAIGMVCCLAGTLFLLAPILMGRPPAEDR